LTQAIEKRPRQGGGRTNGTSGQIPYPTDFLLLRLGELERSEKQNREQPKFSIHSRALFTAMDMPQRRADENQYFVTRTVVERSGSTTGAVSDLIHG
jgi:hypothetical protein